MSDSRGPGYRAVKAEILTRIRRGDWAAGALIPGEAALAATFGCARTTVNRALRELAETGVVERRRKAGTTVAKGQPRPARIAIALIADEIAATGAAYGYRLLSRQVVTAEQAGPLGLAPGQRALHLRCLHLADGAPAQLEDRLISLTAAPQAETADFSAEGPNPWLVRAVPFSDADHAFSAENALPADAAELGLPPGAALFVLTRRTWSGGLPVTYLRLLRPGRGHALRATWSAAGGPDG